MTSKLYSVLIVALAAAMSLSACSNSTTSVDGRGVLLADPALAGQLSSRIQWQQNLGLPAENAVASVTPMDDRVALTLRGNILAMLDAGTGNLMWQHIVADHNDKLGLPARHGKQVLIATESNLYVYNIDSGSLEQQIPLSNAASTPPLADESQVIFGSPSGRVFSQLLRSGVTRWQYDMGSAIVAKPVVMPGMVAVVDASGSVAMLNSSNGHVIWRDFRPPWEPVVAQPVIANSITYVACTDQKLYALDRISGHILWQHIAQEPLTADPVAIGDHILQRTASQGLLCFDGLSGEVIWTSAAPGQPVLFAGGKLWLRSADAVTFVDPESGIALDSVSLPASVRLVVPAIDAKVMYLVSADGRVMKLAMK